MATAAKNPELGNTIKEWVKSNDWFGAGLLTNQLKFQRLFGGQLKSLAIESEAKGRHLTAAQIAEKHDMILRLCIRLDSLIRQGCRNEEEFAEAELLRGKAVAAAAELAEVLALLQRKSGTPDSAETKPEKAKKGEEWITFAHAVEILAVSKPTLTRWADEGKIRCNGKSGRLRKLDKVSVLLTKQAVEDENLKKDVRELREDARKL